MPRELSAERAECGEGWVPRGLGAEGDECPVGWVPIGLSAERAEWLPRGLSAERDECEVGWVGPAGPAQEQELGVRATASEGKGESEGGSKGVSDVRIWVRAREGFPLSQI